MLEATIRADIKESIKSKDYIKRNLLSVIIGEVERAYPIASDFAQDSNWVIVIKKMLKNTEEMLVNVGDTRLELKMQLLTEKLILQNYLPKALTKEELKQLFVANNIEISSTIGEGKSIGNAIKYLRGAKVDFNNPDVRAVVLEMIA